MDFLFIGLPKNRILNFKIYLFLKPFYVSIKLLKMIPFYSPRFVHNNTSKYIVIIIYDKLLLFLQD
jgi:hypothetical protein